ncbi:MAG TPA: tetratricopeptide repeat protein [Firmicutes bacterium]|nr:tetratricopeptide repeat protein [Bacillota bacterium]
MKSITMMIGRMCFAAVLGGLILSAAATAQETNELGLTEEQALAYNAALDEAQQAASQRKFREATEAYRRALEIYADDFLTYFNMGISFQSLRQEDSAQVYFNHAIEKNPHFGPARIALANSHLKMDQVQDAETVFVALRDQLADSIEYVLAAEQGLYNVAIKYTNLAVAELNNRDYDTAEQYSNRAIELAGDVFRPYYIAAMVQERKNKDEDARRLWDSALARANSDEEKALALNGIGRMEISTAKAAVRANNDAAARRARIQAVEHLRESTDLDPNRSSSWINLGNTLFDLGRYDEALDALTRAEELERRDFRIPSKIADTYIQLGDCAAAEAAASRAIALQRTNANAHAVRAEALECLGRKREAITEYETAARDPRWRQRATYQAKKLREELGISN